MIKKTCIYHANCIDGFGAAWSCWSSFGGENCEYVPAQYGDAPPDVTGREVFILDFSYPKSVLIELCKQAESITVIDHHKTAIEDLVFEAGEKPDNLALILDAEHSGAWLSSIYFGGSAPKMIRFIQDRDLYTFEFGETKAVHAYLSSLAFDFHLWDSAACALEIGEASSLIEQGEAILRLNEKHVQNLTKDPAVIKFPLNPNIHQVSYAEIEIVNCPHWLASEVGHELAERNLFGLTYFDMKHRRVFSLRSRKDGIDVSELAKDFGGGGHKNAAGFSLPMSFLMGEDE